MKGYEFYLHLKNGNSIVKKSPVAIGEYAIC